MAAKRSPGLKRSNVPVVYTSNEITELKLCAQDPIYFITNYVYIKHPKRGRIKFALYDYQKEMIRKYKANRFNIVLSARQTGKTETTCAFLLWSAIFKSDQTILVASNKSVNAMEIIAKIQYSYEELPYWLKPGIDENSWNKHTCAFDNRSKIEATTTSADSGRGMAISLLYCDEFAFVKPHVSREFYDSILPTISTGGAMIIASTPKGDVGQFAELWRGANAGLNEFQHSITYVPWNAHPERDEEFKRKFIALLGERKWRQEYECVTGDTVVTIRDVLARRIRTITISDLASIIPQFHPWHDDRHALGGKEVSEIGCGFEILTENGFKDFLTVIEKSVNHLIHIRFSDGMTLDCTPSHRVKVASRFVEAARLKIGDILSPNNITVVGITHVSKRALVYDVVNVSDGNHYITNGITSHNCEFLSEELTLIDSAIITRAERRIEKLDAAGDLVKFASGDGRFEFFKHIVKDAAYLIGVDPCAGGGNDNGVIQVFEFPAMERVLEYTTNTLSPHVMYTELKALINFIHNTSSEIYFSVENNGIGRGILAAYEGDMNPPDAMLISESGKSGVNSNVKTKLKACLQFKEAFERGKLVINSVALLTELKSFIRSQGSYAAQIGATDDRIMAVVVVFYMLRQLASNNPDAYDMIYTVAREIEERHGWTGYDSMDSTLMEASHTTGSHLTYTEGTYDLYNFR